MEQGTTPSNQATHVSLRVQDEDAVEDACGSNDARATAKPGSGIDCNTLTESRSDSTRAHGWLFVPSIPFWIGTLGICVVADISDSDGSYICGLIADKQNQTGIVRIFHRKEGAVSQ
jgi:hypothetical protein